jgi:hypothetical protein
MDNTANLMVVERLSFVKLELCFCVAIFSDFDTDLSQNLYQGVCPICWQPYCLELNLIETFFRLIKSGFKRDFSWEHLGGPYLAYM